MLVLTIITIRKHIFIKKFKLYSLELLKSQLKNNQVRFILIN